MNSLSSPTENIDGGHAFPCGYHPDSSSCDQDGMTLRDYFAAAALQNSSGRFSDDSRRVAMVAQRCYRIADAMIKAREAKP